MLQATPTYANLTPYTQNMGGLSMEKLSHWQQKGRWIVGWWDGTKQHKITMITDHKKLDSVRRYADVKVARKRALMERGKIIPLNRISNGQ